MNNTIFIEGNFDTRAVHLNGKLLSPRRSQKAYNHSPDGFNWGYGGSGPSQLALALMLELAPEQAMNHYQDFKWALVARLPEGDFKIFLSKSRFQKWLKAPASTMSLLD